MQRLSSSFNVADALKDAMNLHGQGKLTEAVAAYSSLIEQAGELADICYLLGSAYEQLTHYADAKIWLNKAVDAAPEVDKYCTKLMEVCKKDGDIKDQIDAQNRWLQRYPNDLQVAQRMLTLCLNHKYFDVGMNHLRMMIAKEPGNMMFLQLMCIFLSETGDYDGGLEYFEKVFNIQPHQSYDICKAFGWALHQSAQFERSMEYSTKAMQMRQDDADLYMVHAGNYGAVKDYQSKLDTYLIGHKRCPDDKLIELSIGLTKLHISGMKEGFEEYRARLHLSDCIPLAYQPDCPLWQGEPLAGKKLLICSEQGIGDIVMFATLIPWLLEQNLSKLTLAVEKRLIGVFMRSFPQCEVMDVRFKPEESYDYYEMIGDLMRYILPHYTPNVLAPVLKPHPEITQQLREDYEAIAKARGAKRIVGIAWFTSNAKTAHVRNIALKEWEPLFELDGVQYISLQYGDHAKAIAGVNERYPGILHVDESVDQVRNFERALAQVAALDEIITIQNATAHFGGAVNKPTTILLSASSDWRWGTHGSGSLWYQSVKVERQETAMQWQSMMQAQAARLKQCLAEHADDAI